MAYICLDCGSLKWYEGFSVIEYYELNENGVEMFDKEYSEEDEKRCYACDSNNILWFNEKKFTKEQLKKLLSVDGEIEALKVLLELCIDNNYDDIYTELLEKCEELDLIDDNLKSKIIVKEI